MMSLEVILQFWKEESHKDSSRVNKGAKEQHECSYWQRNGSLGNVFRNHFGTDLSHLQFIGQNLMNGGVIQIQLFPIILTVKRRSERTTSRILTPFSVFYERLDLLDDLVSIRIINKSNSYQIRIIKTIPKYRAVHFQCILSHVNVLGNEVTDFLAKRGRSEIATTDYAHTYRKIYSLVKIKDKHVWIIPPDHPGISRKSPWGALEFEANRNDQTSVSRLLSGHLKGLTSESGRKIFQTFQVSPFAGLS
ncbi:hypothetical protein TNCV_383421 [Trichonephila clavipes]|nr:hypothetical protein TNCV_383421 [Trichonephila clavipes]